MSQSFYDLPWHDYLDKNPDALYGALLGNNSNKSNNFISYWKSQFGNTMNNYQGALGQQIMGTNEPSLSFYDYLMANPMGKIWQGLSPAARGQARNQVGKWNIRF